MLQVINLAGQTWQVLLAAMARIHEPDARLSLAASSEALLAILERLTERYERSMQALIG